MINLNIVPHDVFDAIVIAIGRAASRLRFISCVCVAHCHYHPFRGSPNSGYLPPLEWSGPHVTVHTTHVLSQGADHRFGGNTEDLVTAKDFETYSAGLMSRVAAMIDGVETTINDVEHAHRLLGFDVNRDGFAQPEEIRTAWRTMARETHPDHGGSDAAFREVMRAARMLLDEELREAWETHARLATASRQSKAPSPPPPVFTSRSTITRHQKEIRFSALRRARDRRYSWLLVVAVFGWWIAPHFRELGIAWDPAPLHDFCEIMQSLDWVFTAAYLFIKKPLPVPKSSSLDFTGRKANMSKDI